MSLWPHVRLPVAIALLWACGVTAADDPRDPIAGGDIPVKVMTLTEYGAAAAPRFSGRVEAGETAALAFRVAGQLGKLNVSMGDRVREGDVLAELDATDYELNVEAKAAEFELASLGADRATALFRKNLISEDQFDAAQTLMLTSQAQLEQAEEQLSFCKLIAPFSGDIAFTYAMPSEVLAANQPVLTLQDSTRLDVHFNLPPQYQPLINAAEKATFTAMFDLLPGVQLRADYKEVSLQPDPDTNSYPMTLTLSRPENFTPRPGMSVKVSMSHPSLFTGSWILPEEALFERAGQAAHVWRIDRDSMTIRKTRIVLDARGAVVSGLQPGDQVVAAGVGRLREGQQVRAWVREGGV